MLIVANWKAYIEDFARAKALVATSKRLARDTTCTVVLAPSAPYLSALALRNKSSVAFAAQDVSATTGGARTGEITAQACAAAGATYALVGHSERRTAGDSDSIVREKLAHSLAHNLSPILCIGERERDNEGRYLAFVREQLTHAFHPLENKERTRIIVAYEPVWAIGKDASQAIGENDLTEMALYIRKVLAELLPGKSSARSLVLYGGSIEAENIRSLAGATGVDGFLIGHASVDPHLFARIVRALAS